MKQTSALKTFLLLFLTSGLLTELHAQNFSTFRTDFDNVWTTTENLGKAIVKPTGSDLKALLIGSGAVLGAALLDGAVRNLSQNNRSAFTDKISKIDDYYGSRKYMPPALITLYFTGLISGNKNIRRLGLKSLQAVTYTGLLTVAVKELVGRSRPYRDEGALHFSPLGFRESSRSFFSGHTSITFATSTVMAMEIDNIVWRVFWYGAAGLVASARIYNDRHWLSDVLAGALVGYAVGRFVSRQYENFELESNISSPLDAHNRPMMFSYSIPLR